MKHFLPAMPFLALLAGVGFEAAARVAEAWLAARRPRLRRAAAVASVALGIVVCLPAVCETARAHPYGLSHYNLLAGGPTGGASLGMNRQFWGYSPRGLLPWLNRTLERGARLYPHDMNTDSIIYYKRDGLLRKDIADVWQLEEPGMRQSSWALVIHEQHFNRYDPALWEVYGTLRPVHVLDLEGVPLVTVYHRGHQVKLAPPRGPRCSSTSRRWPPTWARRAGASSATRATTTTSTWPTRCCTAGSTCGRSRRTRTTGRGSRS